MNNMIELAKAAMKGAIDYHVALEQQRFAAWLISEPEDKRKPYKILEDNAGITATFDDLFSASADAIRREAAKGPAK